MERSLSDDVEEDLTVLFISEGLWTSAASKSLFVNLTGKCTIESSTVQLGFLWVLWVLWVMRLSLFVLFSLVSRWCCQGGFQCGSSSVDIIAVISCLRCSRKRVLRSGSQHRAFPIFNYLPGLDFRAEREVTMPHCCVPSSMNSYCIPILNEADVHFTIHHFPRIARNVTCILRIVFPCYSSYPPCLLSSKAPIVAQADTLLLQMGSHLDQLSPKVSFPPRSLVIL